MFANFSTDMFTTEGLADFNTDNIRSNIVSSVTNWWEGTSNQTEGNEKELQAGERRGSTGSNFSSGSEADGFVHMHDARKDTSKDRKKGRSSKGNLGFGVSSSESSNSHRPSNSDHIDDTPSWLVDEEHALVRGLSPLPEEGARRKEKLKDGKTEELSFKKKRSHFDPKMYPKENPVSEEEFIPIGEPMDHTSNDTVTMAFADPETYKEPINFFGLYMANLSYGRAKIKEEAYDWTEISRVEMIDELMLGFKRIENRMCEEQDTSTVDTMNADLSAGPNVNAIALSPVSSKNSHLSPNSIVNSPVPPIGPRASGGLEKVPLSGKGLNRPSDGGTSPRSPRLFGALENVEEDRNAQDVSFFATPRDDFATPRSEAGNTPRASGNTPRDGNSTPRNASTVPRNGSVTAPPRNRSESRPGENTTPRGMNLTPRSEHAKNLTPRSRKEFEKEKNQKSAPFTAGIEQKLYDYFQERNLDWAGMRIKLEAATWILVTIPYKHSVEDTNNVVRGNMADSTSPNSDRASPSNTHGIGSSTCSKGAHDAILPREKCIAWLVFRGTTNPQELVMNTPPMSPTTVVFSDKTSIRYHGRYIDMFRTIKKSIIAKAENRRIAKREKAKKLLDAFENFEAFLGRTQSQQGREGDDYSYLDGGMSDRSESSGGNYSTGGNNSGKGGELKSYEEKKDIPGFQRHVGGMPEIPQENGQEQKNSRPHQKISKEIHNMPSQDSKTNADKNDADDDDQDDDDNLDDPLDSDNEDLLLLQEVAKDEKEAVERNSQWYKYSRSKKIRDHAVEILREPNLSITCFTDIWERYNISKTIIGGHSLGGAMAITSVITESELMGCQLISFGAAPPFHVGAVAPACLKKKEKNKKKSWNDVLLQGQNMLGYMSESLSQSYTLASKEFQKQGLGFFDDSLDTGKAVALDDIKQSSATAQNEEDPDFQVDAAFDQAHLDDPYADDETAIRLDFPNPTGSLIERCRLFVTSQDPVSGWAHPDSPKGLMPVLQAPWTYSHAPEFRVQTGLNGEKIYIGRQRLLSIVDGQQGDLFSTSFQEMGERVNFHSTYHYKSEFMRLYMD